MASSSSGIPLNSKSRRTKKSKYNASKVTQDDVLRTLEGERLVETASDPSQYSQNWSSLSQQLGLSTKRKRFPPPPQLAPHHREIGESSRTAPAAAEPLSARVAARAHSSTASYDACVSLDCEMVGGGSRGEINMLARCSIVDCRGNVLYDKYVAPTDKVWDYRTRYSGIRPRDLRGAPSFFTVQREVADLLWGKILVGHAIRNDLKALSLTHPSKDTRDTSFYKPFRAMFGGRTPSLKKLAKNVLGTDIQTKEHNSVEDAQATMRLYQLHKKDWEKAKY